MTVHRAPGHDPPLPRRRFLRACLALTLGGVWAIPGGAGARVGSTTPTWPQRIGCAREAATRLGRAYLRDHPDEADVAGLAAAIRTALAAAGGSGDPESLAEEALHAALHRSTRAEYRDADVVEVEGWLLSRSEARLYALISLLPGPAALSPR